MSNDKDEAVFKAARLVVDIIREPGNVQVERLRKALAEKDSPVPSDDELKGIAMGSTGFNHPHGMAKEFRAIYVHACRDCAIAIGVRSETVVQDCVDFILGMATVMEDRGQ